MITTVNKKSFRFTSVRFQDLALTDTNPIYIKHSVKTWQNWRSVNWRSSVALHDPSNEFLSISNANACTFNKYFRIRWKCSWSSCFCDVNLYRSVTTERGRLQQNRANSTYTAMLLRVDWAYSHVKLQHCYKVFTNVCGRFCFIFFE